jgi:hypothetical protein
VTWAIAIPAGALVGFLASRLPMPEKQFDDQANFQHCEFGDDLAQHNIKDLKAGGKAAPAQVEMEGK